MRQGRSEGRRAIGGLQMQGSAVFQAQLALPSQQISPHNKAILLHLVPQDHHRRHHRLQHRPHRSAAQRAAHLPQHAALCRGRSRHMRGGELGEQQAMWGRVEQQSCAVRHSTAQARSRGVASRQPNPHVWQYPPSPDARPPMSAFSTRVTSSPGSPTPPPNHPPNPTLVYSTAPLRQLTGHQPPHVRLQHQRHQALLALLAARQLDIFRHERRHSKARSLYGRGCEGAWVGK